MASKLAAETSGTKLLVREGGKPIRTVLVGYDGSEAAARTVAILRRLGPDAVEHVHAVWVDTTGKGDSPLDAVAENLPGFDVTTAVLTGESVSGAMSAYAKANEVDTIAVGFSGMSAVRDFLFGRGYETLLSSHEYNLLVAH